MGAEGMGGVVVREADQWESRCSGADSWGLCILNGLARGACCSRLALITPLGSLYQIRAPGSRDEKRERGRKWVWRVMGGLEESQRKETRRRRDRDRERTGKRDTLCSTSSVSTVEMCYMTSNTLHCSDCLAIRRSPHAVTELLLPVKTKEESPVPPHLSKIRIGICWLIIYITPSSDAWTYGYTFANHSFEIIYTD